MGKSNNNNSDSDSEHEGPNKDLWKRIKKLENKLHKRNRRRSRRSRAHSESKEGRRQRRYPRSRTHSRDTSYPRSRSRQRQGDSASHSRVREETDHHSLSDSGSETNTSRYLREPTKPLAGDNHSLREVRSHSGNTENVVDVDNVIMQAEVEEDIPVLELHEDPDFLQILGDDPNKKEQDMFEMHSALLSRWGHIFLQGLDKDEKTKLFQRYPLPSNCPELSPPILNPEIVGILSSVHIKRDNCYFELQGKLAKGLSALAKGLNALIADKGSIPKHTKEELMSSFGDSGRILSDSFNHISKTRRILVMPSLNKTTKELVEKTTPTKFLFGMDLGEKIKDAKTLERARKDLKLRQNSPQSSVTTPGLPKKPIRPFHKQPPKSNQPLNRRRPARQGETKLQQGQYPRRGNYYQRKN